MRINLSMYNAAATPLLFQWVLQQMHVPTNWPTKILSSLLPSMCVACRVTLKTVKVAHYMSIVS